MYACPKSFYLWLKLMTYKHVAWQHFIFMIVVVNHYHYHHCHHHQSLAIIISIIITTTMRLKLKSLITASALLQPYHHMVVIIIRSHHLQYLHPQQQRYCYRSWGYHYILIGIHHLYWTRAPRALTPEALLFVWACAKVVSIRVSQ